MPLCQFCGDIVSEDRIGIVWTEYPTETYAGKTEEWCELCRKWDALYGDTSRKCREPERDGD